MSYSQAAVRRDADVLSAPPGQLSVVLHDRLLVSLRRARLAVDARSFELRGTALEKCRAIVSELLAGLDEERGGRLARKLRGVYGFILAEMADVWVRPDPARLDRITGMVTELRDAFCAAAAEAEGR